MFKLAFRAIAAMSTYKQAAGGRYWSSVERILIHLPLFLFFLLLLVLVSPFDHLFYFGYYSYWDWQS